MALKKSEDIAATLLRIASPDLSPKKMLELVKKEHPKAKKKDIIRAAFGALMSISDSDLEKARHLQNFAISERASSGAID